MRKLNRVISLILSLSFMFAFVSCAAPLQKNHFEQVDSAVTEIPKPVRNEQKEAMEDKNGLPGMAKQLTKAEYPVMAQYPETDGFNVDEEAYDAWRTSLRERRPETTEYRKGIRDFYEVTMQEFLKDTEGKNKVYSPLNVYMALAMLAETTDGNSRQQILDLLGSESIEELRNNACVLWNANYCDDGTVTSVLASSAWLSDKISFKQETLDTLAKYYYTSSFSGTMGSKEYNSMLQGWLNEQTGGLLEEQAGKIEMDPQTIFALATTVYYKAKWAKEFNEANNTEDIFHTKNGDVITTYMHQSRSDTYYWGENFSAISRKLENSGNMLLILPDEDVNVESLLTDSEVSQFISDYQTWENSKYLIVNQSIPKFDVVSDFSLIDGLKNLGVTDVFDMESADFTPMTDDSAVAVSGVTHATRVMIDEEGCQAAAFTVMLMAGAAMPPKEQVDFVLDRPFLFVLNGQDGQSLFIGVVNQPK